MDKERIEQLAKLARIDLDEGEAESLSHEFETILNYVGEIKGVTVGLQEAPEHALRNVFREDNNPHESGLYTEALLERAPMREGNYIKVKKIL